MPAGATRIVLGLGNPGPDYRLTRHNVGFRVAEELAQANGVRINQRRAKSVVGRAIIAGRPVVIAKPQTFMNNSGRAALAALETLGSGVEDLLVVCDDFNLELGRLRIRRGGSGGGQKGLASIIEALGTEEFARLRIGIGPLRGDPVDFVLTRFKRSETPVVKEAVVKAAEACAVWAADGIDACMNAYN